MPQLLTLSRAARLVGVTRGALQHKIREGNLATFEGQITISDLMVLYPNTQIEDNTMLERVERIKINATYTNPHEEKVVLPSDEVLVSRLDNLSKEATNMRLALIHHAELFRTLQQKLQKLEHDANDSSKQDLHKLQGWLKEVLSQEQQVAEKKTNLLAKDTLLRVISAHVRLMPSGHEFFVEGSDSLLEAALKAGITISYGCTSGNCGSCKARVISGEVWQTRDHDYILTEEERNTGYILMCSNTATTDLVIEATEAHHVDDIPQQAITAKVKKIEALSDNVRLLHLKTPKTKTLRFLSGQHVNLTLDNNVSATYSLANCPCDGGNLLFHIAKNPTSVFAERIFDDDKPCQTVNINGPHGQFTLQEDASYPALFLAQNMGFAPIKSLIEHAISIDIIETYHLYWLTDDEEKQYFSNICRSWAEALDNFTYTSFFTSDMSTSNALQQIVAEHGNFRDFQVYIAGDDTFIMTVRQVLIENGLPEARCRSIHILENGQIAV